MEECSDCKETILNSQVSNIGKPVCQDECSVEIDCNGEYISTSCVTTPVALDCLEIEVGQTQTEINQAVNTALCSIEESNCTVKIDNNDTCCGNLESKLIAGTGVTITKNIPTGTLGCKNLTISVNPSALVWTDLVMPAPLVNLLPSYQKPQYSNVDELGRVWFRGSFSFSSAFALNAITNFTTTLPSGSRPQFIRTFWNGKGESSGSFPPQVILLSTGVIQVKNNTGAVLNSKSIVTFDGFWIDINS